MDNISCNVSNDRTYRYECTISIHLNPVRYARSKSEFIENLLAEYNNNGRVSEELFTIDESDLDGIIEEEED